MHSVDKKYKKEKEKKQSITRIEANRDNLMKTLVKIVGIQQGFNIYYD